MADRKRVIFVCTGNACRSQMAEGWARHLLGDTVEAFSAGTMATSVDPLAVRAMQEVGVDISDHRSKSVEEMLDTDFDCVVTVCDNAYENCPVFPGRARLIHKGFSDPPTLTLGLLDEEALVVYRKVRDEIRTFIEELPARMEA